MNRQQDPDAFKNAPLTSDDDQEVCGWTAQNVADALGGDVDAHGVRAPKEGHSDEDRSLRVLIGPEYPDGYFVRSTYEIDGEDYRPLLAYVQARCPFLPLRGAKPVPLTDEQRAAAAVRRAENDAKRNAEKVRKRAYWLERWIEASPVALTSSIAAYLTKERMVEPPVGVFRHTVFKSPKSQGIAYGMMAEIVDATTGEPFAFHVTYIGNDGRKAEWQGSDRITPGMTGDKGVGVVKLVAGGRSLCIGEGIETALSFQHVPKARGATIWSGINSANMARLEPLDEFDAIMIAVDLEPSGAGEKAARELAGRWSAGGKRAFLLRPVLPEGKHKFDLNDVVRVEGGPIEATHYVIEEWEPASFAQGGEPTAPPVGGNGQAKSKSAEATSTDAPIGHNGPERNTELGNAHRLVQQHGADIRYVQAFRSWFTWDGNFWRRDDDGEIMRRAEATIETLFDEATGIADDSRRSELRKFALKSQSRSQMENMVVLARHQPSVTLLPDALDANPMLLGVRNGTIDLNTGALHEGRREDYITKRCNVAFDASAQCPNWIAFQKKIAGGDEELIAYKQRMSGLLLTGRMVETLFILYGAGANGKTTEMETLHELLGDYAQAADAGLLISTRDQGGPKPEVVALKGKRAVFINETNESDHLNESRVKYITGNDTIYARDMYEKPINFRPTHKPILRTNHKPRIRGTELGIWRRIHFVPYLVTISAEERDERFREKRLVPEASGILNWMLAGLQDYLRMGLKPPPVVCKAIADYRMDMDTVGQWIDQAIERSGEGDKLSLKSLYGHYARWAENEVGWKTTVRKFAAQLRERGFTSYASDSATMFSGIRFSASDQPAEDPPEDSPF